jgi:hypothetical protein
MRLIMAFAALLPAACAADLAAPASQAEPQSISYETGPCFGACPVYRLEVASDGSGKFEGRRFTAVEGERHFQISPAQYRAFADHLAPVRPQSGEVRYSTGDECTAVATDMTSASVTWRGSNGSSQSLYYYFGCQLNDGGALAERMRAAPGLLPIATFIGNRPGG